MKLTKKGYVCGIAFDHEVGQTDVRVYASVADLKLDTNCWIECGIYEVEINYVYTVETGSTKI